MKPLRTLRSALACALAAPFLFSALSGGAVSAQAPPQSATIAGTLIDQNGALPIPGATVRLFDGSGAEVARAASAADGTFHFTEEQPGTYFVQADASGYEPARTEDVIAAGGTTTSLRIALVRAAGARATGLRTIGSTTTSAEARQALQTSATITQSLNPQVLQDQGYLRGADALQQLPGVTTSTSSSRGDDVSLSIRGAKSSEIETLLDGHPIGPLGVQTDGGGAYPFVSGFNFAATPLFALRNMQVVYGTGALGIYGVDTTGGAVDMQTIEPTRDPHFSAQQGFGSEGGALSSVTATGTLNGKLGYALVHGVQGTSGQFATQPITQSGLLFPDISSANVAANTYDVSGNATLHNDLLKLRYAFAPQTSLTLTGFDAIAWADSTGNGDNDYQTYDAQFSALNNAYASNGPDAGCTAAAPVSLNTNGGAQCYTVSQAASLTSGPAGGGPGRQRTTRLNDYHGRFATQIGKHAIALDAFANQYAFLKDSSLTGGLDPTGTFYTGDLFQVRYRTNGFAASDDIVTGPNDVGFGYYVEHQVADGNRFQYDSSTGTAAFNPLGTYVMGSGNVFVRDTWTPPGKVSYFLNAWLKNSSVTQKSAFEPRLSVVYRPTGNDVVRLTAGSAIGEPAPQLRFAPFDVSATVASLNPNCNGINTIGSSPNANLTAESATDTELAYGHRFVRDSAIQVDLYHTTMSNVIFAGTLPLAALGAIPAADQGLIDAINARIQQRCGTVEPLGATTFFNAANAVMQGIDVTGRWRATPRVYVDYAWSVESSVRNGMPDQILQSNPFFINGAQLPGIPLQKAALGIGYDAPRGLGGRLDVDHLGGNNSYNRGPMTWANLALTDHLRGIDLSLGVQNVFDSYADTYGRIGWGAYVPENRFFTDTTGLQEGIERFGLAPTSFMLTAAVHR